MANAVRIDRPKREPTSAELAADNERLKRKVHNQRRELRRLNAKLYAVCNTERVADFRRGENGSAYQSRAELLHEFRKMHARAISAEAEVERLRKARGDQ